MEQIVISPVPKTIGGGGVGNTMPVSFVPKPLGGPSVVFVLMHMSGASTEMPNTLQPDQSFRMALGSQRPLLALSDFYFLYGINFGRFAINFWTKGCSICRID